MAADGSPTGTAAETLAAGLALALGLYALLHHNFLRGAKCRNGVSLRGKTVLLTGGNTGIGKAAAVDLARRGARVVLACRDKARGEAAAYDIRRVRDETEKPWFAPFPKWSLHCTPPWLLGARGRTTDPRRKRIKGGCCAPCLGQESGNNQVLFMGLDLASFRSVRTFADAFLKSEPRLDVLVNNAGINAEGASEDGFNVTFQVNHLGHFLLTHLLLDRLNRCAPSRVVVVASRAHRTGKVDLERIHKPVAGQLPTFLSYCNSKLANVLYARELANRLEGTSVTCYAVHPGVVNTELFRHLPAWLRPVFIPVSWLFFRDPTDGAQTTVFCATQEGIEGLSGRYFADCRVHEPWPNGRDDATAKKLWEMSERWVGLAT